VFFNDKDGPVSPVLDAIINPFTSNLTSGVVVPIHTLVP
jgi:hypothetical protein